jgi:O-antigen/teichoic acid export membrane protein
VIQAVGILGGLVLVLVVLALGSRLHRDLARTVLVAAPLLAVLMLQLLFEARLRSLRRVILARTPLEVAQPLLIIALTGVLFSVQQRRLDSPTAMLATLVAVCFTTAVTYVLFRRIIPVAALSCSPRYRTGPWLRASIGLWLMSSSLLLMAQIDVLAVGWLMGTTDAGIYSAAARTARFVGFGLTAVTLAAAPVIAMLHTQQRLQELQRLISLAAVGILVGTVPLGLVAVLFGDHVLECFGAEFARGHTALIVLVAGQLINGFAGLGGLLMNMTGHQKPAAIVVAVAALLDLVLLFVLIPRFGLVGAAAATTITMTFWITALAWLARRRIGIRPTALSILGS